MVSRRAISRFTPASAAVFSSAPVACWKRRLNSSWRLSSRARASSASVVSWSRRSLAFKGILLALHELRLDRKLHRGQADRLPRQRLGDARQLEHDAARPDHGNPELRRALAGAHPRLGRLLGHRLVREDRDPDLAAALDLAGHRDTGSLDLAVGDPAGLERLQSVLAELHARAARGLATAAPAMDAAVLGALREEH